MAPSRYHNLRRNDDSIIIVSSGTEADTRATSTYDRVCECCGQEIRMNSRKIIIQSTPTKEDSFFERNKSNHNQPQDINKTFHWKKRNSPKF